MKPIRLLFVCMGNICRSPTAEGVMRGLLREQGLMDVVEVDSAGTGDWHVGHPPDARATAAARARGIVLEGAARVVTHADFGDYDLILAADRRNLRDLRALLPDGARSKVHLLREFTEPTSSAGTGTEPTSSAGTGTEPTSSAGTDDPAADGAPDLDVPDPYYGGDDGFEQVLDLVEAACRGLLETLRADGRL